MEFLKAITAKEAHDMITAYPVSPHTEIVDITEALGRVLAYDVVAEEDVPPFSRSLVDGYAVKVKDTQGARETNPALLYLKGEIRIGREAQVVLESGSCIYLSTGAMIPEGSDGVVMQEYTRKMGDAIEITRAVYRGENICYTGEDIQKDSAILRKGRRLSPFDLGALSALGITGIWVYRKPSIALISSGDEIVEVGQKPAPGQIRDINRYTVASSLQRKGAAVTFTGIAKDDIEDITGHLRASAKHDMILVSGGSSKGERDYVTAAIEKLGGEVLFHGINIKPGKPTIFGSLWGKPIFGLPGHPASCMMVVIRFVLPLVRRLEGESGADEQRTTGILTTNIPSSYGIEEYVRARIHHNENRCRITPLFAKSSVISSLSQASCYIIVPEGKEGFEKGDEVTAYYLD
ncbi:gephyrin-like molybdotransferase Glp [Syntrophorhabdus aromaticivorans]|mgnify:CR=1 FL=1|jgi:molybdopterin molybdotransferase|uniref:Molybdopterin molybdenumtransferase n=1 Tax=Syntrophorhabdus aromaticivorans TaxID=328301 RepID=A0A351U4D4_9BACT|nr:gephyrin-like molybdotransferase Glp [Syntrophorhabdus aromaticivorans]NLW34326.1 molybdopterin molybdotransferase MoeA [Syntrophorhabdus aromaticivorans]HBA54815.1 molybdopterin molybdenumtransferase MoeA [Syntrophorhabdus aromaticivorans]